MVWSNLSSRKIILRRIRFFDKLSILSFMVFRNFFIGNVGYQIKSIYPSVYDSSVYDSPKIKKLFKEWGSKTIIKTKFFFVEEKFEQIIEESFKNHNFTF